jgi:OOP family OmpA-OmpF porin
MTTPDGSPQPAVAILEDDRITLVGAVPSQAAADTLTRLAVATSQNPDLPIDDQLTINSSVPLDVRVRVLALDAVEFPEGSAQVLPEQARRLDGIVDVLSALSDLTVVVVGHTDQRGSDESNLLLSQQRAEAVVAYIVSRGIDAGRLSAQAVGEAELLSAIDDAASRRLNRRVEFVFSGLFGLPPTGVTTTTGAP